MVGGCNEITVAQRPIIGKVYLNTIEFITLFSIDKLMLNSHGIGRLINFQAKFGF